MNKCGDLKAVWLVRVLRLLRMWIAALLHLISVCPRICSVIISAYNECNSEKLIRQLFLINLTWCLRKVEILWIGNSTGWHRSIRVE